MTPHHLSMHDLRLAAAARCGGVALAGQDVLVEYAAGHPWVASHSCQHFSFVQTAGRSFGDCCPCAVPLA